MDLVFVPFMDRSAFALRVGVTEDVLERWIRDGRVRTFQMGKRSLVDMRQWLANPQPVSVAKGREVVR